MESETDLKLNSESTEKIKEYLESVSHLGASLLTKEVKPKKLKKNNCLIRTNDLFQVSRENPVDKIAGVYMEGVHYYDFKNIEYINNTGIATLLDLLKCLLEQGVKVQFVNVNEKIKNKIKKMGLENIINCS